MKKILLAALLAGSSVAAFAQTAYVGVDLVNSRSSLNIPGVVDQSSSKTSGKLVIGYNFNPTWAIEGGYVDLGNPTYNFTVATVPVSVKTDANSWFLAGKATAPINDQFSFYGKLGFARNHLKASASAAVPGGFASASDNKTALYAGIGAQYNFNKNIGWTVELERFGPSDDGGGSKRNAFSTGLRFTF